jgi:hypothetical protein
MCLTVAVVLNLSFFCGVFVVVFLLCFFCVSIVSVVVVVVFLLCFFLWRCFFCVSIVFLLVFPFWCFLFGVSFVFLLCLSWCFYCGVSRVLSAGVQVVREPTALAALLGRLASVAGATRLRGEELGTLVLELRAGGSLANHLPRCAASFSERDAARVLRDVLRVLADVHEAGVLHLDICPGEENKKEQDNKAQHFVSDERTRTRDAGRAGEPLGSGGLLAGARRKLRRQNPRQRRSRPLSGSRGEHSPKKKRRFCEERDLHRGWLLKKICSGLFFSVLVCLCLFCDVGLADCVFLGLRARVGRVERGSAGASAGVRRAALSGAARRQAQSLHQEGFARASRLCFSRGASLCLRAARLRSCPASVGARRASNALCELLLFGCWLARGKLLLTLSFLSRLCLLPTPRPTQTSSKDSKSSNKKKRKKKKRSMKKQNFL